MKIRDRQIQFLNSVSSKSPEAPTAFHPSGTLSAEEAIGVYQEAYLARLTEALGEIFESIWEVLGDDRFYLLANRYFDFYPPQSYNLNDVGRNFVNFLSKSKEVRDFPFIVEMADFESQVFDVFHKESIKSPHINFEAIESDFRICFFGCVRFLNYSYNVHEIWLKAKAGDEVTDISEELSSYMIFTKNQNVIVEKMNLHQYRFGKELMLGRSFMETLDTFEKEFLDISPDEVQDMFEIFRESGVIREWTLL